MLDKNRSAWYSCKCAGVVKLADALDSKSCGVKSVSVRVRPPAPTSKSSPVRGCFSFAHASDAAGVEMCAQMKRSKCAARLLLRVPVGGTRSARPTGLPSSPLKVPHSASARRGNASPAGRVPPDYPPPKVPHSASARRGNALRASHRTILLSKCRILLIPIGGTRSARPTGLPCTPQKKPTTTASERSLLFFMSVGTRISEQRGINPRLSLSLGGRRLAFQVRQCARPSWACVRASGVRGAVRVP